MKLRNFNINLSTFFSLKDKKISVEKAYTEGVYADTPANRKLGRVGMTYAAYAERIKGKEKKDKKTNYFGTDVDLKNIANKLNNLLKYKGLSARVAGSNIEIYKKGDVSSLKNLLASIYSKDYISWGPYENNVGLKNMVQGTLNKVLKENEIEILVDKTEVLKNAKGKKLDAIIEYSNSVEGIDGVKVKEGASDKEKREAIADFYIKNAELEGGNNQIANDLDEIIEDALADYVPKKKEESKKEEKKTGGNKVVLKKINDYFGFEDEEVEWFADTPIALIMADDKEFGEVIDKFTDYQILSQSGEYKNDGSRATMLGCNVEYEIIPKFTADEDVENSKKVFTIDNKTTIRDILTKLS